MSRTEAPSLVQLCIKTAIDNLSHIKDVEDTNIHLLKEILNKCNPDQLSQIENASTVRLTHDRDLSSVTEALWHQFYVEQFGVVSANKLVMMKDQLGVPPNWRQIYEVGDLGYASEFGNYTEYSGAPNEQDVLQYARVVIDEMKQGYLAHHHALLAAKNLKVLMAGGKESKMAAYKIGSSIAIISLGRKDVVAQFPYTMEYLELVIIL